MLTKEAKASMCVRDEWRHCWGNMYCINYLIFHTHIVPRQGISITDEEAIKVLSIHPNGSQGVLYQDRVLTLVDDLPPVPCEILEDAEDRFERNLSLHSATEWALRLVPIWDVKYTSEWHVQESDPNKEGYYWNYLRKKEFISIPENIGELLWARSENT